MTFFKTVSEFRTISEFVEYFEKHAAAIDAMIARGDDVTSEICKLVKATVHNCSRELYFVLLRGVRDKWIPFVDVDAQRRGLEEARGVRLVHRDAPFAHSAFDFREMEAANEVDNTCESVAFLLNKEFKFLLEIFVRDCRSYSSLDSALRHAVWRHICWLDERLGHCYTTKVRWSYSLKLRQIEKEEYESHFYIAIEALNFILANWDGKQPLDLRWLRSHIEHFDSPFWRRRYLDEFDKYFGPSPLMLLGAKPKTQPASPNLSKFGIE
jgi:hypothetical protein